MLHVRKKSSYQYRFVSYQQDLFNWLLRFQQSALHSHRSSRIRLKKVTLWNFAQKREVIPTIDAMISVTSVMMTTIADQEGDKENSVVRDTIFLSFFNYIYNSLNSFIRFCTMCWAFNKNASTGCSSATISL